MSLKFLPFPIYMLVCLFVAVFLVYTAIDRRKKDSPCVIAVYYTVMVGTLIALFKRWLDDVLKIDRWNTLLSFLALGAVVLVALEFTWLTVTYIKKKKKLNKTVIVALILLWAILIFFVLIIFHVIH